MKLVFSGRAGSSICTWNHFALLRDNVQHFIERGELSGRFPSLHAIEVAVDQGECAVNALRLRCEVLQAYYALKQVPMSAAAVSLRSHAILTGSANAPARWGTVRASDIGWELPVRSQRRLGVPEAASNFVVAVLALSNNASHGELLQVHRCGDPPRFARSSFRPKLPPIVKLGAMALAAFGLSACATSVPRPASAPEVQRPLAESTERAPKGPVEPLVAPPPAYGNKIVGRTSEGAVRDG